MADIETDLKKWGNSLGVRLPRALLRAEGIGPGDRVHVSVEKAAPAASPDAWGFLARLPQRTTKDLSLDEFRRKERAQGRARERRLGLR